MADDTRTLTVTDRLGSSSLQQQLEIAQKEQETMRTQIDRLQQETTRLDQEIRLQRTRIDKLMGHQ